MKRAVAVFVLALLPALPAIGQVQGVTWEDPTLEAAVLDADLIVLARATKVAKNGAAYRVEKTLKGPDQNGLEIAVTGLHHPELRPEGPAIGKGELAYLVLRGSVTKRGDAEGLCLPTPTLGRFVRREDLVVGSLGGADTFVRDGVTAAAFESLLRALADRGAAQADADTLLNDAREVLGAEESEPDAAYLALESIRLFGAPVDREAVENALDDPAWADPDRFRVRVRAALALGTLGGDEAAIRLLRLASEDEHPGVKSVALAMAAQAITDASPNGRRKVVQLLADKARVASAEPCVLSPADDPRTNTIDSPLASCLQALALLRSRAGIKAALAALKRDDLDAIQCGLDYFETLADPELAGEIAERMRPKGPNAFANKLFMRTLEGLTGQRLGDDRDAWLRWWKRRSEGAAGPPKPGGGR